MYRIDDLLRDARRQDCSDVHFTVGETPYVRQRGTLFPMQGTDALDSMAVKELIAQMAPPSRREQIGMGTDSDFTYVSADGERHRVNVYRQRGKLAAAVRLLRAGIPTLDELQLPAVLENLALMPRGLVLVTGPTGSGKSTTLAAMVDAVNRARQAHILTIEDPVEYQHTNKGCMVSQREVGEDTSSFADSLRSALREDPDVILVGEMRDLETISAAVTAAETGHLVLSTLHTTGAAATIDRIIDVFPPHQQQQIRAQLAAVLVGVISQTLVPKKSGRGRIAALEILVVNEAVAAMIRDGKTHHITNAIQTGKQLGMQSLDGDLARLVTLGAVEQEEALSRCQSQENFRRYLSMRG